MVASFCGGPRGCVASGDMYATVPLPCVAGMTGSSSRLGAGGLITSVGISIFATDAGPNRSSVWVGDVKMLSCSSGFSGGVYAKVASKVGCMGAGGGGTGAGGTGCPVAVAGAVTTCWQCGQ